MLTCSSLFLAQQCLKFMTRALFGGFKELLVATNIHVFWRCVVVRRLESKQYSQKDTKGQNNSLQDQVALQIPPRNQAEKN